MAIADEIRDLQELHQNGALTDGEFAEAKAKLLRDSGSAPGPDPADAGRRDAKRLEEARQYAMFIHLSMLAGFAVPMAGLVVPIVLWQMKKDELPGIDQHGKNAVNWIISEIIYIIACIPLIFIIIGIPLLIIVGILGIIFPIIAGIKASKGEVWHYPLSFTFIK